MFSKKLFVAAFAMMSLSMTACSGGVTSWLQGVDVKTGTSNGTTYVKVSAQIDTGAIVLVPVILPVYNPNNSSQVIGSVMISSKQIDLTFQTDRMISLPGERGRAVLPNGLEVSLAGFAAQNWIKLPAKNGKTMIYLNYDLATKKVAFGAAVNVEELNIGTPAAILPAFDFSNVTGFAGIYTGLSKETNGFTIFADASKVLFGSANAKVVEKRAGQSSKIEQKVIQLNTTGAKLKAK